jgi:homeobox-leucine zipper protein
MDFGDEPEGSDSQRQRKRYHRHTPRQIQQLEAYDSLLFRFLFPFLSLFLHPVRPRALVVVDGVIVVVVVV